MNFNKPPENRIENKNKTSYEEILSDIDKIINDSEQVKNFISNRLNELKNNSTPSEIGAMSEKWHSGFIHPDSPIRRSYMVDPFYLNDDSVYGDIFSVMKKYKEHDGWKDRDLRQIMPFVIQQTIVEYFGNLASYLNTERDNQLLYFDHTDMDSKGIPIKEFKGKKIAVCAEKATMAQNIATFLGLESYLVLSNSCRLSSENAGSLHVYNIFKSKKGYFIYDPTNPAFNLEKDTGEILDYNLALYRITEEEFNQIKNGGEVSVKHIDRVSDSEKNLLEEKPTERIYGGYKK